MTERPVPVFAFKAPLASAFAAVVFFSLCVFYFPYLTGAGSFFYTDTTFGLEPMCRYLRTSFQSGHIPLWNGFEYCGMPQIAIPFPSIFYLPDYLFCFAPFNSALAMSMIFHQLLASIGMYWMLLCWRLRPHSAIVGGVIYGLSGYMFSLPANYSLVAGAAWFPICLGTLGNFQLLNPRQKLKMMFFSGFCIAQLILSGRPEVFVPSLVISVLYGAFIVFSTWREAGANTAFETSVWYFRSFFFASVLCMPSLLSTGEWLAMSRRASGMLAQEVFMFSASWYDFVSMLLGQSLGNLHLNVAQFRPLVLQNNFPPFVSCAYVGPVTLALAIWGISKPFKFNYFVIAVLVVAVTASLGENCFVTKWAVDNVPGLSFVRIPVKFLFLVAWSLSIFAAQGFEAWTEKSVDIRNASIFWALLTVVSGLLVIASALARCWLPFIASNAQVLTTAAQARIAISGLVAAMIGFSFIALAVLEHRKGIPFVGKFLIAFTLLFVTLFANAINNEHMCAAPDYFNLPSYVANATFPNGDGDHRILNLCLERLTIPRDYLAGSPAEETFASYQYNRDTLKPNTNIDYSIPSSFGFEGSMKGDYYYLLLHCYLKSNQSTDVQDSATSDMPLHRFCTLTSTEYVVTQIYRNVVKGTFTPVPLLDSALFKVVNESLQKNIRIYSVLGAHPHCFVAERFVFQNSHNDFLAQILSPKMTSFDPVTCPVVEAPGKAQMSIEATDSAGGVSIVRSFARIDSEHQVVRVSLKKAGLLVVTDQNYPGWEARLDGMSTTIRTVNGFMRSVFVPVGNHEIEFEYKPRSLWLGWIIFMLGLVPFAYLIFKCLNEEK